MKKIYKATLPPEERSDLTTLASTGKSSAAKIKHANILLAVDERGLPRRAHTRKGCQKTGQHARRRHSLCPYIVIRLTFFQKILEYLWGLGVAPPAGFPWEPYYYAGFNR